MLWCQGRCDCLCKNQSRCQPVQIYTALVYKGPGLFQSIRQELADLLHGDGVRHIKDVVGVDADRLRAGG